MSEGLEELIEKKYNQSSFRILYRAYRESSGVTKKVLGNLVASRLGSSDAFVDIDDLDDILDSAKAETLWDLSLKCDNDYIQSESFKRLEKCIENEGNYKLEKAKMKRKNRKKVSGGRK